MDRLGIIFNCLLVATGLLQAIALGFTALVSNKAANAAKAAAEAIPTMERPYIFIHGISFRAGQGEQSAPRITYNVSNNGKLAAIVENVSIRCGMERDGQFPPLIIIGDHLLLQLPILSAEQERDSIEYTVPNDLLQYEPPTRWPIDRMIFQVVVTYHAPFTKEHETAQCLRFTRSPISGFVEVSDPRYTYMG
jgi:hypothetical protein